MKIFRKSRPAKLNYRPRASRRLSLLLTCALGLPYLMVPAAALAAPSSDRFDVQAWEKLQIALADARKEAAAVNEGTPAEQEKHRSDAIDKFSKIARTADRFSGEVSEYETAGFYRYNRKGVNDSGEDAAQCQYLPRLVYGYAKFEIGRLEQDKTTKRIAFGEAGQELNLAYLPQPYAGVYRAPAIQLIALLGQLENYRGRLDQPEVRENFHACVLKITETLADFDKKKLQDVMLQELEKPSGLGLLLTKHSAREERESDMKAYSEAFMKEVMDTLKEQIPVPTEIVLQRENDRQFSYAFPENEAPVALIQTIRKDGQVKNLTKFLAAGKDTLSANPNLTQAALQVDADYVKLAERLHPEQKKYEIKTLTWQAGEESPAAILASVRPDKAIETQALQIPKGAITLTNLKAGDKITLALDGKTLDAASMTVPADSEEFHDFAPKLTAFGRSAKLTLHVLRGGIEKLSGTEQTLTVVSDAKPQAQVGLASDFGAFGVLAVRYADFDPPTKLTVDDKDYPMSLVASETDAEGRNVYLLPIYSPKKSADVKIGSAAVPAIPAAVLLKMNLTPAEKKNLEAKLAASLKLQDGPLTLEQSNALAMAKTEHSELEPLLSPLYNEQETQVARLKIPLLEKQQKHKELAALASAAGLTKQYQETLKSYDIPVIPVVIPPAAPALLPAAAWSTKEGLAIVSYELNHVDIAKGDSISLTINDQKVQNPKEKGAVCIALASNAKGEIQNDVEVRVVVKHGGSEIPFTQYLKAGDGVPEKYGAIITQIKQFAGASAPAAVTQAVTALTKDPLAAKAVGRLVTRQILQQLTILPATIESEAELNAARDTLGTISNAYLLLTELDSKKLLDDEKNTPNGKSVHDEAKRIIRLYKGAEKDIQEAYQPGKPQPDVTGKVVVTTWASPEMLRLGGKKIEGIKRDGNSSRLIFTTLPGTTAALSLEGTPAFVHIEEVPLTVPSPPKEEPIEIAMTLQNNKANVPIVDGKASVPISETLRASCTIKGNHKGLDYKWQILQDNKVIPMEEDAGDTIDVNKKTLNEIAKNSGVTQMRLDVTRQNMIVKSETTTLNLVNPKKGMAFLVGINDYAQQPLAWMREDVLDFRANLIEKFGYDPKNIYAVTSDHGKIFLNDEKDGAPGMATQEEVGKQFAAFMKRAKDIRASHFIIYFSGHGAAEDGDDKLAMANGKLIWEHGWAKTILTEMPRDTGLALDSLTVIGLYQACRDGNSDTEKKSIFGPKEGEELAKRYYALPSCAPGTQSDYDNPQGPNYAMINHGYFGAALLRAMDRLARNKKPVKMVDLRGEVSSKLGDVIDEVVKKHTALTINQAVPDVVKETQDLQAFDFN